METPQLFHLDREGTSTPGTSAVLSAVAVVCIWLAAPARATACAVCFDPDSATRGAYLGTTLGLTLLPLLLVVGVIAWLLRANADPAESPSRTSAQSTGR